ncbi:hypothetical protein Misp01_08100 [Microtetraspora sp. NBRC 13810]|uniref:FAD-dependent monooxygenase n=1 Tax=Microtetraspora sp. NBRC 13810 TaxID=3030990 RepID=UPI0024A263BD|nr:FAD-dependent monooxygenase [Microtetraspora sp. NBRC 13810]GLW05680.1 hypothetical protein Misp01_08100 [Microtetraspora sp. NBRC 13810]
MEYLFGDSVTALDEDGAGIGVTFQTGPPRRFDLVIGADGLHSNVRRLAFGEESRITEFIGAYLAVFAMPAHDGPDGEARAYTAPGRTAAYYTAAHLDEARAVLIFRRDRAHDYHHRDIPRQKALVREAFAGAGWEVPRLLDAMDAASAFYFDSITQVRMDGWSRGRVSLAGDAAMRESRSRGLRGGPDQGTDDGLNDLSDQALKEHQGCAGQQSGQELGHRYTLR